MLVKRLVFIADEQNLCIFTWFALQLALLEDAWQAIFVAICGTLAQLALLWDVLGGVW